MAGHAVLLCGQIVRIFMEMRGVAGRLIDGGQLQFTADQLSALRLLECLSELRVSILQHVAGEGTARSPILTLPPRAYFALQSIQNRLSRGLVLRIPHYIQLLLLSAWRIYNESNCTKFRPLELQQMDESLLADGVLPPFELLEKAVVILLRWLSLHTVLFL